MHKKADCLEEQDKPQREPWSSKAIMLINSEHTDGVSLCFCILSVI